MIFIFLANTILTSENKYRESDNLKLNSSISYEIKNMKSPYQKYEKKTFRKPTMEDEIHKYDFNTLNEFLDKSNEFQEIDKFDCSTDNPFAVFEIENLEIRLAEYQDYINKLQAFLENQPDCGLIAKIELFVEQHQHFANQYFEYVENYQTHLNNEENRLILDKNIHIMQTNLDSCTEMIGLTSQQLESIEKRLEVLDRDVNEIDSKFLQIKLKDQDAISNEQEIEGIFKKLCYENDLIDKINLTEMKLCLNYAEKLNMSEMCDYTRFIESLYEKTVKYISEESNFNVIYENFKTNLLYKSGFTKLISYFASRYGLNLKIMKEFYIMSKEANYVPDTKKFQNIHCKTLYIDENTCKVFSELDENEFKLLSVIFYALGIFNINCDDQTPGKKLIRNIRFLKSIKNLYFTKVWNYEDLKEFLKADESKIKDYLYVNSHLNDVCIEVNKSENVLGCHYFLKSIDFEELKDCENLFHLDYSNTNISQLEMESILQLSHLVSLALSGDFTVNFDLISCKKISLDFLNLSNLKNEYIPGILNLIQTVKVIVLPLKNNMDLKYFYNYKSLLSIRLVGSNGTECYFENLLKLSNRKSLIEIAPSCFETSDLLDGNFTIFLRMFKLVKIFYKQRIQLMYRTKDNENIKNYINAVRKIITTLETLKSSKDLTHLEVSGANLVFMTVKKSSALSNLTSLSFLQTNLTSSMYNNIFKNLELNTLHISKNNFTDKICALLYPATLSNLSIEIELSEIMKFETLAKLPNPRNLKISKCKIENSTFFEQWKIVEKTINQYNEDLIVLKLERKNKLI